MLLLERTQVRFPTPTSGRLQQPITQARDPMPLSRFCRHLNACGIHSQRHTYTKIKINNKILRGKSASLCALRKEYLYFQRQRDTEESQKWALSGDPRLLPSVHIPFLLTLFPNFPLLIEPNGKTLWLSHSFTLQRLLCHTKLIWNKCFLFINLLSVARWMPHQRPWMNRR